MAGDVVKAVTSRRSALGPEPDVADVEVEGGPSCAPNVARAQHPASSPGSRLRCRTGIVACVNCTSSSSTSHRWSMNVASAVIPTSVPGGPTVKLRVTGDTVRALLQRGSRGTGTPSVHLAPGKCGFRGAPQGCGLSSRGFRATSGGVHVESMSALLLEADGGPVQTLDPYFTGSANWQLTNGASVANNRLTLPNTGTARQGFLVAGQGTVEVRLYIAQVAPGAHALPPVPEQADPEVPWAGTPSHRGPPTATEVRLYAQNVGATP